MPVQQSAIKLVILGEEVIKSKQKERENTRGESQGQKFNVQAIR